MVDSHSMILGERCSLSVPDYISMVVTSARQHTLEMEKTVFKISSTDHGT